MPIKKAPEAIVTKTGVTVQTNYCRKCMRLLPAKDFYECVDAGFIDANGLMSVCKDCIQSIYDTAYAESQSIEKAIHKVCVSMNIRFSNEAVSATKTHIQTLLESGKLVNAIFGVYKQKLIATKKSMDKSGMESATYEDVGTIFTSEAINTKEIPIPQDVIDFWGGDLERKEIEYLETEYANFKNTHKAETYAQIILLKQICYALLRIRNKRINNDPDVDDDTKMVLNLMNNSAITPKSANTAGAEKGADTFGLWIQDIEKEEPAQWLATDPRGDIYRDVADIEGYFQKYLVRPLKNFIQGSKDFNIGEDESTDEDYGLDPEELKDFKLIDDGDTGEE